MDVTKNRSLVDLFMRPADLHPARPALWVNGRSISYDQLKRSAETLAAGLSASRRKIGDGLCAVLTNRSETSYSSVIGSMLAGLIYVPLNVHFPTARNVTILEASGANLLIVDETSVEPAREILFRVRRPLIVLMPDSSEPPKWHRNIGHHRFICSDEIRGFGHVGWTVTTAEEGAYLLFTSGSTGTPKGVMVTHRNALTYISNVYQRYRPTTEDRFSQVFDLTFDLSIHDMFLCWAGGSCLYSVPDTGVMGLFSFIRRHELTFWFSVPSTAAFMEKYRMLRPGAFPTLRWSLFCGEVLSWRLAALWQRAAPNSVLENLYGPTEATIAFTVYRLPPQAAAETELEAAGATQIVPIGNPLSGQEVAIIGEDGRPVPDGEVGELCLGGAQVAPGYWNQLELTELKFAAPVGYGRKGRKWYRTGDLAKFDQRVGLRFLGRSDNQVKIRGYRVELHEIEGTIREAAETSLVAVVPWPLDDSNLPMGVVAFISGSPIDADMIKKNCGDVLPHYMVPSEFIEVHDWPLDSNGKTDYFVLKNMLSKEI